MSQKFIKRFFFGSISLLLLCILAVVLFDPFFQYHKPLPGLKAVLTDKEYQCVGSLKTLEYDSVIAGSSVAENYNNGWFDQGFHCKTIKAIRSYGATADLCYLLDIAFERRELKYVFYNLDPSALVADPETTYELTGCPMYLYDDNYINDVEYWLNKGVLMEKIPYLVAHS
ncbi:MAG: SGNH/GDSL hydrolase family protein, partial [Lachnospiraceae bacterium]|nr:SGNH/GDSL hydrolase family protein [Lachnospiraceae bacterium]